MFFYLLYIVICSQVNMQMQLGTTQVHPGAPRLSVLKSSSFSGPQQRISCKTPFPCCLDKPALLLQPVIFQLISEIIVDFVFSYLTSLSQHPPHLAFHGASLSQTHRVPRLRLIAPRVRGKRSRGIGREGSKQTSSKGGSREGAVPVSKLTASSPLPSKRSQPSGIRISRHRHRAPVIQGHPT